MINNQTLELQANLYVYDLKNSALENGFKAGEAWELTKVTQAQKNEIERQYRPIISTKVAPEALTELFGLVKAKLSLANTTARKEEQDLKADDALQYLVAFNPNRIRR